MSGHPLTSGALTVYLPDVLEPSQKIPYVDALAMKRLEADYTALRAHAERLAEALEKAEKKLCSYEVSMDFEYGQCRDLEEFEKDNLWGPEIIEARQALTLYRAENPKV